MIRFQGFSVGAAGALIFGLSAGNANAVIVGNNNTSNCYPFSCGASDNVAVYQQIYSSTVFSNPISFGSINFFKSYGDLMDSATYKVSFSTTSKAIGELDNNYLNNIGDDNTEFGQFNLSGLMPDVLTLTGNIFNYNPSAGNLLMTVEISNLTESNSYKSFFQADYTGLTTSRLFTYNYNYTGKDNYALVTQFNEAATVPESTSTLALLGLAALSTGSMLKRKQQRKSTVKA